MHAHSTAVSARQSVVYPAQVGTIIPVFWISLSASLLVSALVFFLISWRWPLVGDASAMHYLAFLMERGWAPYRQLADQQFPGAYLVELAGMHIFGMSSLAWRLYDFTLLILASFGFLNVTESEQAFHRTQATTETGWFSGLFAACLFILIHGRDGLAQGGQRDFTMSVLLLLATAFLFTAVRRRWLWCSFAFGLFSGLAFSIKPTVLPLSVAQLLFACYICRQRRIPWRQHFGAAAIAYLAAPAVSIGFLIHEHAVQAFVAGFRGILPYYASLAHRSLSYILVHSVSPLLLMVFLWVALQVIAFARGGRIDWIGDWERTTLLASALFALLDCIIQARALPYYRYPLLAFLLPLMSIDFYRAVRKGPGSAATGRPLQDRLIFGLAISGFVFGGFFLAPQSAILIHRYRWWQTDFITSLQQNLYTLGGAALSGHIQCIDSISGCPTVLYDMRLEPASGALGDYLLFGPDNIPIVQQTRFQFARDIFGNPPEVIVVSSHLHLDNVENFHKLSRWPQLASFLTTRYDLATEWAPTRPALWWSRPEVPASYRIYRLRHDTHP